jgi:hypothetical protein
MCLGTGNCTRIPWIAGRILRQLVFLRVHADFDRLLGLLRHVDLAARIVADDHHRQAGRDAVLGLESLHVAGNTAAQPLSVGFSVDDLGGHGQLLA